METVLIVEIAARIQNTGWKYFPVRGVECGLIWDGKEVPDPLRGTTTT